MFELITYSLLGFVIGCGVTTLSLEFREKVKDRWEYDDEFDYDEEDPLVYVQRKTYN